MPFPVRISLVPILILGLSGATQAAESMAPLRIDPALLGLDAGQAQAPRAAEKPAREPAASTAEDKAAAQAREKEKAAAKAEAAPPAAKHAEPPKAGTDSPPAKAAVMKPAQAAAQPAAANAEKIPPRETVEAPKASVPSLQPQLAQPPVVEERAALPPLYSAHVEAGVLPEPALQPTTRLSPLPREAGQAYPVFVAASRIEGRAGNEVVAEGTAELRKSNTTIGADRLTFWKIENEVEAAGSVRLTRDADVMTGPKLRLNLTDSTGFFEQPKYSITRAASVPRNPSTMVAAARIPPPVVIAGEVVSDTRGLTTGRGAADHLEFQGENRVRLTNATYSTCTADKPDWYAQAKELRLDYDRELGEADGAKLVFKDTPLFYTPWLSFSLNNKRKSGLLAPTFGSSTRTGAEVTVPYYWNIAPNMEATIAPRYMAKRGTQLNAEYRYINYTYNGEAHGEWLPQDYAMHQRRGAYSLVHNHTLGYGFSGSLNINGVSDPTYFTDLSSRIATTSQTNLLRQGLLAYSGGWWGATANIQRYQTLQDPAAPLVVKPYDRMPQLTLSASRPDFYNTSLAFNGEYVDFNHPTSVIGQRTTLYPQISLPFQTPAWYVTPKIGYHVTRYDLTRQNAGTPDQLNRQLPIFSIDSGVTFVRDLDWQGRNLTQTLEPRLYYLNVPLRHQDLIPNFDSGANDFNFSTIFSENVFAGGDRIADANQITAALTSRLIDPQTGQEYVRGMIGQRYYFNSQEVTLPGVPVRPGGAADFLAALSGRVVDKTYVDAGWQYNPRDQHTERLVVGGRWQPDIAKVLNASYRFSRDSSLGSVEVPGIRQIDVSGQWPLGQGWYGVGRYNYSLRESKLIETVGGLEYNGGCWVARFVVQRFATTTGTANTAFFAQLELNEFSRIGSNPLEMLKRNIPGYGRINQPTADPAFGAN
jgi:LPS-assembly protein